MIDIRHLELVRALAEHKSLSGAARSLGYSQPAISQQLRLLEARIRTPIAIRGPRGVELTEAGYVLLAHSADVLSRLALAEAEMSAIAGLRAGKVRIAAFPSAAATVVTATLATMTRRHPGITFTMAQAEPPEAFELLEHGQVDIAVVFRYSTAENEVDESEHSSRALEWVPLLEEEIWVAVPGDHPFRGSDRIDLADLKASRWITGCPNCRQHLVQSCDAAGYFPEIAFETDDYVALQNLAAAGLGVAMLPELLLSAVNVEGLHLKRLVPPALRQVSAVVTAGMSTVPAVRETLAALRQASAASAGKLVHRGTEPSGTVL